MVAPVVAMVAHVVLMAPLALVVLVAPVVLVAHVAVNFCNICQVLSLVSPCKG